MSETHKAQARRIREGFFDKYVRGRVIDIGCGGGPTLTGSCDKWDVELGNGDATFMGGIADESYETVYSSHLLEHLADPFEAIRNWWRILKPGGYLILYVPHKNLYEKKDDLPSRWNGEHKWFFLPTLRGIPDQKSHWLGLTDMIHINLPQHEMVYVKTCDDGFTRTNPKHHADGEYSIEMVLRKPCRKGFTFPRNRTMPVNTHRHGWEEVMRHVRERFETQVSPVELDDFMELSYLWTAPLVKAKDWVGIIHAPESIPWPYQPTAAMSHYFRTHEFLRSLDRCRGLITLSEHNSMVLRILLEQMDRKTDVYTILHPTEFNVPQWNPDLAFEKKQLVNLGYWMRDFSFFDFIQADGWKKMVVASNAVETRGAIEYYEKQTERIVQCTGKRAVKPERPDWCEPDRYDLLLTEAVCHCRLLGSGANNAILECIARCTPILVNPVPSAVEYLGGGYPLFCTCEHDCDALLADQQRILAGHQYLKECPTRPRLTYDYFCHELEQFL